MRIRALSVFEGVVYHCYCADPSNPCRPTLEVEAVVRAGDVDQGPLLVSAADYLQMVGFEVGRRCLAELRAKGRIVRHLGVDHLEFRTWTPVELEHR
ncbi:MAG: hypothetical protein IPM45_12270 [Acidimicrobiales bacterium]|nr:hypothetical protein [Acidimicrobiales bacterium]